MCSRSSTSHDVTWKMAPPPQPMTTADHAGHVAQPAVMDTRPASTPLHICVTLQRWLAP